MKIKKMIMNNKFGLFGHKTVRPVEYCELYGINQLSSCDRDGSYDSFDFVGTIDEVNEYERRWCSNGINGFRLVAVRINRGFKNQSSIIYI
jgi:hypothetical protein